MSLQKVQCAKVLPHIPRVRIVLGNRFRWSGHDGKHALWGDVIIPLVPIGERGFVCGGRHGESGEAVSAGFEGGLLVLNGDVVLH